MEDRWRDCVRDAQLRLAVARNSVTELHRDLESGHIPSLDGTFAYQKALRIETMALAEFCRVLRIFTDLILEGKIPDANTWQKSA